MFAIACVAFLNGCSKPMAPPPRRPAAVIVGQPLKENIVEWDEYVGRLEAVEFVEVRARVSGYLSSTHFQEGQMVKAGDLLATIDQRPFIAELNKAEADVTQAEAGIAQSEAAYSQAQAELASANIRMELAERTVERWRALVAKKAAQPEDLDTREAEFSQAQANIEAAKAKVASADAEKVTALANVETAKSIREIAKLNLFYTEVKAPITGRISKRDVTEGNLISGGTAQSTLLTTIVSLNPIHVVFDADEAAFLKYTRLAREGSRQSSRDVRNPVFVAFGDELVGFPHEGHMDFVENRLDEQTGTIRGRAILPNPDLTLTPGLFARVRIPGSARYEAILIPDRSIGTDQSEKFVLKVNEKNEVLRQVVKLGPMVDGLRVIRAGLDGSEAIILNGLQRVRPGDTVTTTVEKIIAVDDGLPKEYEPVPEEKWLKPPGKPPLTSWHPVRLPGDPPEPPRQMFHPRDQQSSRSMASGNERPERRSPLRLTSSSSRSDASSDSEISAGNGVTP